MNLKEFLEITSKPMDGLTTLTHDGLDNEMLFRVKDLLFTLDEFKDVEEINILTLPSFLDNGNDEPNPFFTHKGFKSGIKLDHKLPDDNGRPQSTPTINFDPEKHKFGKKVDLYSIQLGPKVFDPSKLKSYNLGEGIWHLPTMYDPITFTPLKEIKIIWNVERIQDGEITLENLAVEKILDDVRSILTGPPIETNVEFEQPILIRCSSRSILQ
jgi:hypothetical protein